MKKVIVSAFCAFFSIGMFAQANTANLPNTAQNFINKYFSSVTVEGVDENSKWEIWADDKYEVKLSNGIELDFDENGNLLEIDSQNNEAVPMEALPANVRSYLMTNHADAEVIGWEMHDDEQEVELSNGVEVEFDSQGNFRKLD